nr:ABC transporter permease subunit [Chthoniobacterales bacterium]
TYYHLAGPKMWKDRHRLVPGLFDNEAGIEAIRNTRRLAQNYFQKGAFGMSHTEAQLEFFLGNTAMIPCGAWLKSEMAGKIPAGFEMGCFNLPTVSPDKEKADPTAIAIYVEPMLVFKTTPERERASVDFLRFMTSRKMAGRFSKLQDLPTAIRGASEGNLSADLDDLLAIIHRSKSSFGLVAGEGYSEMKQQYYDFMHKVIAGDESPETTARSFEARAQIVKSRADDPDRVVVNHVFKPILLMLLLGGGALLVILRSIKHWKRSKDARVRAAISEAATRQRLGWRNVLLFAGPTALVYTLFVIYPSLRAFAWSLHAWNGLTPMSEMPFKGLLNFRRLLFQSNEFWIAINNNLFLMVVVPLFVIPLAMFLAAALSRGVKGATLFRVVFFFPNLIGGVAATLLWMHLYNPKGGLLTTTLVAMGNAFTVIGLSTIGEWFQSFDGYAWLSPANLYWSLIPISVWGTVGFNMVLYLAAMESIPESYYEAAKLDGAGPWRQFWNVTLPLIWDIVVISIVFLVIAGMKAFDVIWLLTNQQPQTDSHVITTRMVQTMFNEFRVGEATALAVLLFLMVLVGSAATLRGLQRESVEM